jgi:hypothetical protein
MVSCEKCSKHFRDNYDLSRHMSRIIPCKVKTIKNSNLTENKTDCIKGKTDCLGDNFCKYCLNEFSSKKYKNIHETSCKQKDDPIRLLEIEQDINPVLPDSKTCCRYCDKKLSRTALLNKHTLICKERIEYHALLEKQKNQNTDPIVLKRIENKLLYLEKKYKNSSNIFYESELVLFCKELLNEDPKK